MVLRGESGHAGVRATSASCVPGKCRPQAAGCPGASSSPEVMWDREPSWGAHATRPPRRGRGTNPVSRQAPAAKLGGGRELGCKTTNAGGGSEPAKRRHRHGTATAPPRRSGCHRVPREGTPGSAALLPLVWVRLGAAMGGVQPCRGGHRCREQDPRAPGRMRPKTQCTPCAARTAMSTPRACSGYPMGTPQPRRGAPSLRQQQSHGGGDPVTSCPLPRWQGAGRQRDPSQVDGICPPTGDIPGSASCGRCPWHLAETPVGLRDLSKSPMDQRGWPSQPGVPPVLSGAGRAGGDVAWDMAWDTSPSSW